LRIPLSIRLLSLGGVKFSDSFVKMCAMAADLVSRGLMSHVHKLIGFLCFVLSLSCVAQEEFAQQVAVFSSALGSDVVSARLLDYKRGDFDWRRIIRAGKYVPSGNYLNWSCWSEEPSTWADIAKPDVNGVVTVTYDGGASFVYNPTTIALQALYFHSVYMRGGPLDARFKADADFLLQMQGDDGALRCTFAFYPFLPGWVSGQAQGHAISVWTRAYKLFGQNKYLDASRKSFEFMLRDVKDGGCLESLADLDPDLGAYHVLTELPFSPCQYALDGSIFPLFGIYDWAEFDPSAMIVFTNLVESIRVMLPYYEMGGISAYDLQYVVGSSEPVVDPAYHALNTALVWTLSSIAPNSVFEETWNRWAQDVGQPGPSEMKVRVTPSEAGHVSVQLDVREPVWTEAVDTFGAQAWHPSDIVSPDLPFVDLPVSGDSGFLKLVQAFPLIDRATLNGSFEIWNNPFDMTSWEEVTIGGTVNQEAHDVHEGDYSCRIDATSTRPAGMYRYGILVPGAHYFLEFWAKASAPANLNVYFGPGRDPVRTFALEDVWTHYTVSGDGTSVVDSLALYSATSGISVYLDDVKFWQFGSP
jgi:hypothetical protein